MKKEEFLTCVAEGLAGLPQEDIDRWLDYYREMLDDRVEDGIPEESAVAMIGTPDEVAKKIIAETPLPRLIKARVEPVRHKPAWVIVLLVLGAPLWLSLLITALAVVFAVYVTLWSVMLALFATGIGLLAGCLGGVIGFFVMLFGGNPAQAWLLLGGALICGGAGALLCLSLGSLTKGILKCGKAILTGIKSLFAGKGTKK